MAKRSTRNKIRHQGREALADLQSAQDHITTMAVLADGRSPVIERGLSECTVTLQVLISIFEQLYGEL